MRKLIIAFFIAVFPQVSRAQLVPDSKIDEMVEAVCEKFESFSNAASPKQFYYYFDSVLAGTRLTNSMTTEEKAYAKEKAFSRLQTECTHLIGKMASLTNGNEMLTFSVKPGATNMHWSDIRDYKKLDAFYYYEPDSTKVGVTTNDNYWQENYSDGSYVKFKKVWTSETGFKLVLVDNTNEKRKNWYVEDAPYRYELHSEFRSFYLMVIDIPNNDLYYIRKIYKY